MSLHARSFRKSQSSVLVRIASNPSRDRQGAGFSLENRADRLLTRAARFKVDQYRIDYSRIGYCVASRELQLARISKCNPTLIGRGTATQKVNLL